MKKYQTDPSNRTLAKELKQQKNSAIPFQEKKVKLENGLIYFSF
tara:strand:+ start:309 stop:440 length:132 start_codon:yes stop_codon:yes gene_type:complete